MKISKSAVSSHYQQAHKKTLSKQKVRLLTTKKIARKISPNVVAEKPSDMCSVCKADFDINASVYCLKTGEAKIVCRQCTTVTIMRGAFKVPKHLHSWLVLSSIIKSSEPYLLSIIIICSQCDKRLPYWLDCCIGN